MKKLLIAILIFAAFGACNSGGEQANLPYDTVHTEDGIDSMPVIDPDLRTDTSAVFNTPPTNDNNVIMPDSTRANKP